MRMVIEALKVSRSNIQYQVNKVSNENRVRKSDDKWLISLIKEITDTRPTYGYRRVTALLNLKLMTMNKDAVNLKRIYRIMKENDLLLAKYGSNKTQAHDGKIITLTSNMR
jgi:putative transposase